MLDITNKPIIITPCPIMALTTDIVSGRMVINMRLTSVAAAVIARIVARASCKMALSLFMSELYGAMLAWV
jgi:hypothetical protein